MLRPSRSFADCGARSGDWRPFNNLFLSALTLSVISLYFLFRHDKDVCEKKKAVEAVECWLMSEVLESLVMGDVSEGTR